MAQNPFRLVTMHDLKNEKRIFLLAFEVSNFDELFGAFVA